jgi:hypothetical protein
VVVPVFVVFAEILVVGVVAASNDVHEHPEGAGAAEIRGHLDRDSVLAGAKSADYRPPKRAR